MNRTIAGVIAILLTAGASIAWACKPPDPVTGLSMQSSDFTSVTMAFDVPAKGGVSMRVTPTPAGWGEATSITCPSSPCVIDSLQPSTTYAVEAIPFLVTKTQGTLYGNPSTPLSVTTPKPVTLKDALHEGVNACLDRKLAHTACFKALNDALGKVTQ